jgi:hypothetical protein
MKDETATAAKECIPAANGTRERLFKLECLKEI